MHHSSCGAPCSQRGRWNSLEPLEQTTAFNIERLVRETEGIILDECTGWSSSGSQKNEGASSDGTAGDTDNGGGEQGELTRRGSAKVAPAT